MDGLNRNLASARNTASRASRQYRCLHNHAVLSPLWHVEFRFRSFISICLFYNRHTKLPSRKCARPRSGAAGAGHGHVPGGSAPVLAACVSQLQVGPGTMMMAAAASADACFAARGHLAARSDSGRLQVGSGGGGGLRSSPPEAPTAATSHALVCGTFVDAFFAAAAPQKAPAAATSASALQALKILQRGSCRKHIK